MGRESQIGVRERSPGICALLATIAGLGIAAAFSHAAPTGPYPGPLTGPGVSYGVPIGNSPQINSLEGGTSIGRFSTYSASTGTSLGTRVLLWDTNGSVIPMQTLGTSTTGSADEAIGNITPTGQIVGWAEKYSGTGSDLGQRAVRWNSTGAVITELAAPFLLSNGTPSTSIAAWGNSFGVVVGSADKATGFSTFGNRPVVWAADGTPTVLGDLGTNISGYTDGYATGINDAGTIVGSVLSFAQNFSGSFQAVRWAAGSTTPTVLGNLGTDPTGVTDVRTGAINAAGITIGSAQKYVAGQYRGTRAVAWLPGQTGALELANLGTGTDVQYGADYTETTVAAINNAGTMVGSSRKYGISVPGTNFNYVNVATAWDTTGAVRELADLTSTGSSYISGAASDVNNSGIIVGTAEGRAVYWTPDGNVVDLNSLLGPSSPWQLSSAVSISDDDWVTGVAYYYPNGPLGDSYQVEYTLQLPEPFTFATLLPASLLLLSRRRRSVR